jgi:hypothetical protein
MINEIATSTTLIVEYGPPRVIDQIVNSTQNLILDTSHISPRDVTSASALQYLLHIGYSQIPKLCLRLNNGVPTIHTGCAKWLAKNNCLSLLKEMFQHNPDFEDEFDELYYSSIKAGSLDVAKWLHDEKGMQRLSEDSVIGATQKGHLDTIEWIVDEFKNQINWKSVIKESYSYWRSHKVIDYIESKVNVTLEPEIALYRLAVKGDLTGLQTALSKSPGDFPWQSVADGAARGGHAEIVQWVHDNSSSVHPTSDAVENACQMGNFSVLKMVYKIDSSQVVSGYERGKVNVLRCFLYAAMHNKSEEMEWILNNPLKDKLPSASDMYSYGIDVLEEVYLRAFKQIAETKGRAVFDQEMMLDAAIRGHVKVFQWLHEQGLAITAEVANLAAQWSKVEILKAIHTTNSSLVCTVEIANAAVMFPNMWKFNVLDWMHKTCEILPTDLSFIEVEEWVEERSQW